MSERGENLFIRVKIEDEFRFVAVHKKECDVRTFLTAGRDATP